MQERAASFTWSSRLPQQHPEIAGETGQGLSKTPGLPLLVLSGNLSKSESKDIILLLPLPLVSTSGTLWSASSHSRSGVMASGPLSYLGCVLGVEEVKQGTKTVDSEVFAF
jgi:hypothetical protein